MPEIASPNSNTTRDGTQKWEKMAKLNRRRRWRGPALGGRLQRAVRFCFAAHDGEATSPTLTEWCRPEVVHAGRRPTTVQMVNQARALRSIGAKRVRRAGVVGCGDWATARRNSRSCENMGRY